MSKTLLIIAHPNEKSFNHCILRQCVKILEEKNQDYTIIDLYKEQFNPVLDYNQLTGQKKEDSVSKYYQYVMESDKLVIISPIWWFIVPAILKGFFDKVSLKNLEMNQGGVKAKTTSHIHKVSIFTTSGAPTFYLKWMKGNLAGKFLRNILVFSGIKKKHITHDNMGLAIKYRTDKSRKHFLSRIITKRLQHF